MKTLTSTLIFLLCSFICTKAQSDIDTKIAVNEQTNPNTFALIVSNEHYKYEQEVPFALNDGETFKLYCEKTLGIPSKNIRYAPDATLNEMTMLLQWLQKVMEAYGGEAKAVVYYSGHGMPSEDGNHAYLLPIDGNSSNAGSGMDTQLLYKLLGEMPSAGTLVFLDACFCGARRDGQMLASSRGVAIKPKAPSIQGNMVVFSAAKGDETAYPYSEKQHGLFTYHLLEQLQQNGGRISLGELADNVTKHVQRMSIVENNKSQTPTVTASPACTDWRQWMLAEKRATRYENVQRSFPMQQRQDNMTAITPNVHQASAKEPLLPKWMNEVVVNKWVGASPPTPDMRKGRNIAMLNAALSYLRSQQVGKMVSNILYTSKCHQTEDNEFSFSEIKDTTEVEYSGFTCDVTEEYYNSRGEYFVRCAFMADKNNTRNKLVIKKRHPDIVSSDGSLLSNASISIHMTLDGHEYGCNFLCFADEKGISTINIFIDGQPIKSADALNYEALKWNSKKTGGNLYFGKDEVGKSIGIIQMAVNTLLPFIPSYIHTYNDIQFAETRQDTDEGTHVNLQMEATHSYHVSTYCEPIEITPISFSGDDFVLKLHSFKVDGISNLSENSMMASNELPSNNTQKGGVIRLLNTKRVLVSLLADITQQAAAKKATQVSSNSEFNAQINTNSSTSSSNNIIKLYDIGVSWGLPDSDNKKAKSATSDKESFGFLVVTSKAQ